MPIGSSRLIIDMAFGGAALAAAFAAGLVEAQAEGALCGARALIVAQLETRHGESRRNVGLQQGARVMETYANDETGTWTIIVALPSGVACLVATGEAFREEPARSPASLMDDPA